MISSQQKTIGIAAAGAILLFLLKGKTGAQILAPSEEITPSIIPPITPSIISFIEPSAAVVAQSPTPAPTKSIPSIAPSSGGDGGTMEDILANPVLRRIISESLKIGENEVTGTMLTQGAAAVALINLGISTQQDFTNPYSNIAQGVLNIFPVLGTVVGGFIEGIIGSPLYGAGEEWIPEMIARGNNVNEFGIALIKKFQDLSNQEPYISLLAVAQYTKEGWAIPFGWTPPSPQSFVDYGANIAIDPAVGYAIGAWQIGPTGTIEDWATPWVYGMQGTGLWYGSGGISLPPEPYKRGINLFSILGLSPIVQAAFQAASSGGGQYIYQSTWSELGGPPSDLSNFLVPPQLIAPQGLTDFLRAAGQGNIANMIDVAQKEWAAQNYGIPTDWNNAISAAKYLPQYFYATGQSNPLFPAGSPLTNPLLNDPTYLNALKVSPVPTQGQIQAAYNCRWPTPAIPW